MAESGRKKGSDKLALAIASGKSLREAAKDAGIGERTARRRWAEEGFRKRVMELRADMVERSMGRMSDAMTEAVDTLRKLLKAKGESVRLSASRAIIELGVKLRDSVDHEKRLQALEDEPEQRKREDRS